MPAAKPFDPVAALFANQPLLAEVNAHNSAVMIRRRRGADWSAPENQYRNVLTELASAQ